MALTDNPMSLVVTGNVTVGATLEASVPTTETRLLSTMDVNTTVTITVPAGVKVLKVEGMAKNIGYLYGITNTPMIFGM